jgi:signal transduction histidine kinase
MIRPRTLRARFVFWTTGLLLAALTIFGVVVYESMSHNLLESLDDALAFSAAQVAATLEIENGEINPPEGFDKSRADLLDHEAAIRIVSPDGRILLQAGPNFAFKSLPENLKGPTFTTSMNSATNERVRTYILPVEDNGHTAGFVETAQSFEDVNETMHRLLMTLLIGVPFLALLVGVGGHYLATRALAPIDEITRTARRISAEDLGARLHLTETDDEVGRLASTFNGMLERLHKSFLHERQFTADASHELRTPITAMISILDAVRAKRRTPSEYELALADLAKESERLRTLTENLLRLAQSSSPNPGASEPTDLSILLHDVADSMRPLADSKGIALKCDVPMDLIVRGDNDDLIRLFVNLLENAVKYTHRGAILLSARAVDGQAAVSLQDTGIGIPQAELPYVFDRFYRVEKSRSEGSAGLGLAIALEIVQSQGGSIDVQSEEGQGTTFVVRLILEKVREKEFA